MGALLTEALRQLSDQQERGDQAESARITEQRDCLEVVQRVEGERDDWWRKYNGAKVAADVMEGERDAAIRERDLANDAVDAWHMHEKRERERAEKAERERDELREARMRAMGRHISMKERAEKAEALLRECMVYLELGSGGRVLLAKIREALPK